MAAARIRYAAADPTLPKPWKGLIDGKTGFLYFWNPETNVTQYQRPTGVIAPTSVSSETRSSENKEVSQGQCDEKDVSPGQCDEPRECSLDEKDDEGNNGVKQVSEAQCDEPYGYSLDENDGNGNGDGDGHGNGEGEGIDGGAKLEAEVSCNESSRAGMVDTHNALDDKVDSGSVGSSIKEPVHFGAGSNISAEAYRRQHEISVSGNEVPAPFTSFQATGFPSELLKEIHSAGFSSPTPIQAQSWPVAIQGRDIVAIAKTGSGKTLGYLIPGFLHLKRVQNNPEMGPTVLVLSPTRELATQIQDEAIKFGKSSRIICTCLYGGAPKGPQLRDLDKGVDIVVATPGRLNDIIEMRRISLHQVSYLVLDEADRMLDMGFEPQIRKIVNEVPTKRQTLMYTATWPKEVRKIAADLSVNPVQVNIGNVDELVANKSITQHVEVLTYMEKHRRLEQIIRSQEPGSKIIIFCATKKMCDQLANNLNRQHGAAAIHGDKSQSDRDYVLNQFRTGRSPVLVATDVAARGLDVKDIRVVVNYDFPTGVEDYVHRIGRTGRGGATGIAYTFFGEKDAKYASDLIKILKGANQQVPPGLRDLASSSGGFTRPRQWSSAGSGGQDGGYSGRSQSSYGGRGDRPGTGGRFGSDNGSKERHQTKSWNTERNRSRSPDRSGGGAPAKSFHQMMMEQASQQNAKSQLRGAWPKD